MPVNFVAMGEPEQTATLGKILGEYAGSVGGSRALADSLLGPVWRKAYKKAGEPHGVISDEEGYRLAGFY